MRNAAVAAALIAAASCTRAQPAPTPAPTPSPVPATAAPSAEPAATPSPDVCPGCFDLTGAMRHERRLTDGIGGRRAGTEGARRAAEYIRDALAATGLRAELRAFDVPNVGETWNVVAARDPGLSPGPYLIVGGHYDTLGESPGANDNASGIAAILEIARALSVRPSPLPVVFVAFGAEERQPGPRGSHHFGSRRYVEAMTPQERSNLVAMLNVDMIAFGPKIFCARLATGPREATARLVRLAGELGIPAAERVTPDWSDNGTFLKAGLNAGWTWSGEDPAYHSARDTLDHVRPDALERAGRLVLAAVRSYEK